MYYCDSELTSWAVIDDLYDRYGREYIDKLASRTVYDEETGSYVLDQTTQGRLKVLSLALQDAKYLLLEQVNCKFKNSHLLDTHVFYGIKQWHIKLAIRILKEGGDCTKCNCEDLEKYLGCSSVCSQDGVCLPKNQTVFSVSEAKFKCECVGACKCC